MADTAFSDLARVDARDKVMGAPIYGADRAPAAMTFAIFATATIAKGTVTAIDTSAAQALDGVRLVATHAQTGGLNQTGFVLGGGYAFQNFQPMLSDRIAYRGQPIALVVADTLEAATEGAALVTATYESESFASTIGSEGTAIVPQSESPLPQELFGDTVAGDAEAAWGTAATTVDNRVTSLPQHQNPMELIATVAEWDGDDLTIHEGTQNAAAIKWGVAAILGIDAERVTAISPSAGGAFGQKNSLQMQTALVAWAAREIGAPVKMVVPRAQLFHDASFRAQSHHRVRLGADADGTMTSILYDVDAQTSRHDFFPMDYTDTAARLYGVPNFRGYQRLIQTDTQTPGYMRAPYEHMASFALDSAVDEMAVKLGRDPVEYRQAHDTDTDPVTGLPLSSRHLSECLRRGAEAFGWSGRSAAPGSMVADNGDLIGLGVGCGCYKGYTAAAVATLKLSADGTAVVSVGVHEMGQGVRTALANAVAAKLSLPPEKVSAIVGDTRGAPQQLTAGSWGTATSVPAAEAAADKMIAELGDDPLAALRDSGAAEHEVRIERLAPGQPAEMAKALDQGMPAPFGPVFDGFVTFSYVAHFVEVRIEPSTRRIRVPRVVSVADCGRVVSPRTAASQVRGGVIWGIGAALREASEVDPRYGGFLNVDIADYVIPVNADIGTIETHFIDEPDPRLNDAGVKGLGEVVMTGVASGIANAIHHATGKRMRDLPIRIEDLL